MAAPALTPGHIHLPSVHVRHGDGGFDYEEDIYVRGSRRHRRAQRVVRLVVIENGAPILERETRDELCTEEFAALRADLPVLMEEGNEEAEAVMQQRARLELARQYRIAAGEEQACAGCGCLETRACSGGCLWATRTLCSRCIL